MADRPRSSKAPQNQPRPRRKNVEARRRELTQSAIEMGSGRGIPGHEALEERLLLAVVPAISQGVVTFSGDNSDDVLTLRANAGVLEYSVDGNRFDQDLDAGTGGVQSLTISALTSIGVSLGAGMNNLRLDGSLTSALATSSKNLTHTAGAGSDTLTSLAGSLAATNVWNIAS